MSVVQPTPIRFGRQSTRGFILGFSLSRAIVLAIAVGIIILGLFTAGMMGLLLSAVLWLPLVATAFIRIQGRPAVEWSGTTTHYAIRAKTGQTEVQSTFKPRPAGTMALPGDGAPLRFYVDPRSGAAMVHDPHRNTLSASLTVTHNAFVLLDADSKNSRVATWGRLLSGLSQSGTVSSIQVTESTTPDPARGQVEWFEQTGVHDGRAAEKIYTDLLDTAALSAGTHRTVITLTLDLQAARRAVAAAGRGIRGGAAVLRSDMGQLLDSLRACSLRPGPWLGEAELAAIIRSVFDPDVDLDPRYDPGANLSHAGPMAISEHWSYLRHTGAFSSVLWISEWPRIQVRPDFLHGLIFSQGVRRTMSILIHPLATDEALRQIRKEKTEAITDSRQRAKVGQIADLSEQQEYADIEHREQSIIQGHTDCEFAGFVLVTAPTLEALEAARSQITRAATQGACEVRPVFGRQLQSLLMCLPLGRRPF